MKTKSLKNKVYKTLRLNILTRKIPSGTRITEISVAQDLDVSRTPVREALQKLALEKLITAIPRAGYIVEDMSDDDIQDLFSSRMEIELIAIKKAVMFISVEELKLLDDNIEKSRACIKSNQLEEMMDLDVEFYSIIYKASRSKTLYRICKNLNDISMKYRHRMYLENKLWNDTIDYHISIYQALITKDEKKVTQVLRDQAILTESNLLKMMKKVRSDSFSAEDHI